MTWKHRYPHISNIESLKPTPRVLLGMRLFWTYKLDGSNLGFWIKTIGKIHISSRNLEDASQDLETLARATEEYSNIAILLGDFPQFIVYAELCRKGRSVTGIDIYDRDFLVIFDIYDLHAESFLNYTAVYQHCYHYKIPCVKLYAETRHRTMKDLMKFCNHVTEYCKENHLEGMVIKTDPTKKCRCKDCGNEW